jgi:hypothetical protein
MMDCRTARLLLDYARPRTAELEAAEVDALQCHLVDCGECAALAQAERMADHRLGQAMRAVVVPEGLRTRLLTRVETEYRTAKRRTWLRRAGVAALAASLLMGLWLGIEWKNQPVSVDTDRLAYQVFEDTSNPLPDTVQAWFKSKGTDTIAPPDFNYGLLKYYGVADLQGKRVPLLLFVQGKEQARVYILSDKQFDFKDALANPPGPGSGCKVELRPSLKDPHLAYLVVYTGESLVPFLAAGEPSTT